MSANTTLPIKWVWNTDTSSLASATRRDSTSKTLYCPMTTSRSFRSVVLRVTYSDGIAGGNCTLTNPLIGIKLGAAAFDDATLGAPSANTGDNQTYIWTRDVTSYFNTNFGTGTSQTCQVGVQASLSGTSPNINNITIEIIAAVDVDTATDNTQWNYVEFVCDSSTTALTATLAEIGTNQFPDFDAVLPEASRTIRQVWLELEGNNIAVGTANDASLGVQIDNNSEWLSAAYETGNASGLYYKLIYDVTSLGLATGDPHAIKLRSSNITTAATFNHTAIRVCVLYEYSWSGSSRVLNMAQIALPTVPQTFANTAADANVEPFSFDIQEPGTITMVQCGVQLYMSAIASATYGLGIGSQTPRVYTSSPANYLSAGSSSVSHRIDSGGAAGSAITLARGVNSTFLRLYGSSTASVCGYSGYLSLLYTSDKSSLGRVAHVRTIVRPVLTPTATASQGHSATIAPFDFLDTSFSVVSLGIENLHHINGDFIVLCTFMCKSSGSEMGGDAKYVHIHNGTIFKGESENATSTSIIPCRDIWQRHATDPDTNRMALKTSRACASISTKNMTHAVNSWCTYHGHIKAITGTISDSNAGTVTITAWSKSLQRKVGSTSRSGNGAYSIPWYNDTASDIVVEAREGASYLGRSDDTAAA